MTATVQRPASLSRERLLEFAESRTDADERATLIDLAGHWKHGYIPLDEIAWAIKRKKAKGDGKRRRGIARGSQSGLKPFHGSTSSRGKSRLDPKGSAEHTARSLSGSRSKHGSVRPSGMSRAEEQRTRRMGEASRSAAADGMHPSDAVRAKAPELKAAAGRGDKVAAAELKRRADKRTGATSSPPRSASVDNRGVVMTPAEDQHASDAGMHAAVRGSSTEALKGLLDSAPAGSMQHAAALNELHGRTGKMTHTELAGHLGTAKEGSASHAIFRAEGEKRLRQAEHPAASPAVESPVGKKKRAPSRLYQEFYAEREAQMRRFEDSRNGSTAGQTSNRHGGVTEEEQAYFGEGEHMGRGGVEKRLTYADFRAERGARNAEEKRHAQAYAAGLKLGKAHGLGKSDPSQHDAEYEQHSAGHDGEMFAGGYGDGAIAAEHVKAKRAESAAAKKAAKAEAADAARAEQARKDAEQAPKTAAYEAARRTSSDASGKALRSQTEADHKAAGAAHVKAGHAALAAGDSKSAEHHLAMAEQHGKLSAAADAKAKRDQAAAGTFTTGDAAKVNEKLDATVVRQMKVKKEGNGYRAEHSNGTNTVSVQVPHNPSLSEKENRQKAREALLKGIKRDHPGRQPAEDISAGAPGYVLSREARLNGKPVETMGTSDLNALARHPLADERKRAQAELKRRADAKAAGSPRTGLNDYGTRHDQRTTLARAAGDTTPVRLEGNDTIRIGSDGSVSRVASLQDARDARAEQSPRQIHDRLQADPSKVNMDELQRLSRLGGPFGSAANAEIGRRDDATMKAAGRDATAEHAALGNAVRGGTPDASPRAAGDAKAGGIRIEHNGDGTLVHGTERGDKPTIDALKSEGFKYSSRLGAWYLPRTWQASTREQRVQSLRAKLGGKATLERGSMTPQVSPDEHQARQVENARRVAEQQTARAARLRAESDAQHAAARSISDHIPFGQPILVGHHSERRHRNDLAKIDRNMRRSMESDAAARHAEGRAQSAEARANAVTDPKAAARRLERNQAELRSIERAHRGVPDAEKSPGGHARHAQLSAQIKADQGVVGEGNGLGKHNVKPGDIVMVRGTAHVVHSTGPKNAKLMTSVGPLSYPYHQMTSPKSMDEMSTDGLKKALANSRTREGSSRSLPPAVVSRIEAILRSRGETT